MAAVSTMILASLTMIGEKQIGDTLDTNEQTFYLAKMNTMLESWSIDRTDVYSILQENFALTVSTATYTIGSGGVFNTARPVKIVNGFVRDSNSYDAPVGVINQAAYNAIKVKSTGNSYPTSLYFDGAFPLATIYLYPAPIAGLTLYINSYKQLQSFAALSTALSLPPGYQRAIETNFAIECAPGLINISPELAKIAKESLAAIRRINLPETISRMDSGVAGIPTGNIITGP